MGLYGNLLDSVGFTPTVKIGGYAGGGIYAKLEYANPSGSVKDRAALSMIRDAEKRGVLVKNGVIVEPTSGNTGIALAMVGALSGYRVVLTMPESMSTERRRIMSAYGAELILTPAADGMSGAISKAKEIAADRKAFMPNQFENESNVSAHYFTTAPEIIADLPQVKWVVAGVGSGGTVMGIKKYFKAFRPNAQVCAVEPKASAVLSGGSAGAHKIQGIGAGFIPSLVSINDLDAVVSVTDGEAIEAARRLLRECGIFGGISSGANYAGALKLAESVEGDILFIVPDGGAKYLSGGLYTL